MSKLIATLNTLAHLSPDEIVKRISDPWIKGSDMTPDQHQMLLDAPGDRPVGICHWGSSRFMYDGTYTMRSFNMQYVQDYLSRHYFCLVSDRAEDVWPPDP